MGLAFRKFLTLLQTKLFERGYGEVVYAANGQIILAKPKEDGVKYCSKQRARLEF